MPRRAICGDGRLWGAKRSISWISSAAGPDYYRFIRSRVLSARSMHSMMVEPPKGLLRKQIAPASRALARNPLIGICRDENHRYFQRPCCQRLLKLFPLIPGICTAIAVARRRQGGNRHEGVRTPPLHSARLEPFSVLRGGSSEPPTVGSVGWAFRRRARSRVTSTCRTCTSTASRSRPAISSNARPLRN
jgi:hypothetical protein